MHVINPWMNLAGGKRFFPLFPESSSISIEEIARGLAGSFRFRGQPTRYTVAQHSIAVAQRLEAQKRIADAGNGVPFDRRLHRRLLLWGLLHDAAETYTADIPTPLKQALAVFVPDAATGYMLVPFAAIEQRILEAVARQFHLPWPMPVQVAAADDAELRRERRWLWDDRQPEWPDVAPLLGSEPIEPLTPDEAEAAFLAKYRELIGD